MTIILPRGPSAIYDGVPARRKENRVKLLIEILLSLILHPIAVVLSWINILGRSDYSGGKKVIWMLVCLIWGIGPILYILLGDGELW
jgi:hypothetical protein